MWSSSTSWAETDLRSYMFQAAENAPLFLEAFFEACEILRSGKKGYYPPEAAMINEVCLRHQIGYEIRRPELVLREAQTAVVTCSRSRSGGLRNSCMRAAAEKLCRRPFGSWNPCPRRLAGC